VSEAKRSNESLVTTLSLSMLVIVAAAVVMLMMKDDPRQQGDTIMLDELGTPPSQNSAAPLSIAGEPLPSEQIAAKPAAIAPAASAAQSDTTPKPPQDARMAEVTERFEQAVVMLHAKEYEHAATALHRVMELSPRMPEVYVNMGYAKLGQQLPREALVFFETATQLKPEQANAYWGMAVALESVGDLAGALGAMRTFLHLSSGDDNFARRARSALWEWEEALARGPLPEEERAFLERGALQWESRNTPRDDADSGEQALQVKPIQ